MHQFQKWREALQLAPNSRVVAGIVRDYVNAIQALLCLLPPECRSALEDDPIDVQAAAVTLLRAELRFTGSDEDRALLHEAAHTLASAAVRITLLHATGGPPEPQPHAKAHGFGTHYRPA